MSGSGKGRLHGRSAPAEQLRSHFSTDFEDKWTGAGVRAERRSTEIGAPAIIVASPATEIRMTSARLNGGPVADQAPSEVTFFYGPSEAGTDPAAWPYSMPLGPTPVGLFSTPIAGLPASCTIYYRARATNANGEVWSDPVSFTTLVWRVSDNVQHAT